MLKSVVKPEVKEYISNFAVLANLLNESANKDNDFMGVRHLIDYISLLKFKIDNNLLSELKIDSSSGMVSFVDISQLIAEKNNLDLKLEHSFTPEEIRDKLIKGTDSIKSGQDFDISRTIASLANRHYLSMLKKADINEDITLSASLAESGDSDLIRIITSGYCLPLSAVCSYETDLYAQKKRLGKKKIKIDSQAYVSLSEEFSNKLFGWFGLQSNIIYEFIKKEKGFEPRRVKRIVFAPFYSKLFEADNMASQVDPHYLEIYKNILSCHSVYVLSVHTDTSTKHFDPSYETDGKTEKPNITIEHKYFCTDKRTAKQLEKYVSKKEIVVSKNLK